MSRFRQISITRQSPESGGVAFIRDINLTNLIIPDTVTSIGLLAFVETGLTTVTIPGSVTDVSGNAFAGCESLTNVTLSNTTIGDGMFLQCTNLGSVFIPDTVTNLGDEAFLQCTRLTNVIISDGVTSIGDEAFEGCTSLTSLVIPASVTNIGSNAFEGSSLTNVSILGNANVGEYAFYQVPLISVNIAAGTIGNNAFESCPNLTSLTLGSNVTIYPRINNSTC
jgi:hypothetical protein